VTNVVVTAEGHIELPASLRRRLGLDAGAELEVSEEPDGVRLRIIRARPLPEVARLAGLVTAPSRGRPRRLEDFDPASLLVRRGDTAS
jgi:antitoxin PrlF